MTVEEIDIIVQASVEQAVKEFQKLVPEIKKQTKKIKQEIESSNIKDIVAKVDLSSATKEIQKVKKQMKEVFNPDDTSGMKIQMNAFNKIKKTIQGVATDTRSYKAELGALNKFRLTDVSQKSIPQQDTKLNKMYTDWGQGKVDLAEIRRYKQEQANINNEVNKTGNSYNLWSNTLRRYYALLDQVKVKLSQLKEDTQQIGNNGSRWNTYINNFRNTLSGAKAEVKQLTQNLQNTTVDKLKSGLATAKTHIFGIKKEFNTLPKITQRITNNIKNLGTGMRAGLKQVLAYAGALFGLNTIYSMLKSSATAWLSSQNAQAQQLNANIQYMKYTMR